MALNMSDDEDIDFRRQHFQHPDDADDIDLISESDGEAEQVNNLPRSVIQGDFLICWVAHFSTLHIISTLARTASYLSGCQ